MNERQQVPVRGPDGRVIGQATVTETEEGLLTEMTLPGGREITGLIPGRTMSFAFFDDPAPHDPLASQPPRVREKGELP